MFKRGGQGKCVYDNIASSIIINMIKQVTLHPSRIGCPSLPGTMKGIVISMEGVKEVIVRYEERSLDITLDDEKISADMIIKKIGQELGLMMEEGEFMAKKSDVAETCPM